MYLKVARVSLRWNIESKLRRDYEDALRQGVKQSMPARVDREILCFLELYVSRLYEELSHIHNTSSSGDDRVNCRVNHHCRILLITRLQ